MNNKAIIKVLRKARTLIRAKKNWVKNSYGFNQCYCLNSALCQAGVGEPIPNRELYDKMQPVYEALGFGKHPEGEDLERWNDVKSRTHEQVLARIDNAILKLQAVA